MTEYQYFASCPKNIEALLEQELISLGAHATKQTVAGVYFAGSLALAYKVCLWSRLCNRVLLILQRVTVNSTQELYDAVYAIDWLAHMLPNSTMAVDFAGQSTFINHSHFGALKIKDGLVDKIRAQTGQRPSINLDQPDIRVNAYLDKGILTLSIDLSGASLHQRGYRLAGGKAPLKENLAAAILLRANWPTLAEQGGSLIDPMCGSGTLLIEAVMQAADIAPGLQRTYFGFTTWQQHQPQVWQELLAEAEARREQGLKQLKSKFYGYDADARVINLAKQNIARADLQNYIQLSVQQLESLTAPLQAQKGLIITNPPYGERLNEEHELRHLYKLLGSKLKQEFVDWQAAVFTGNPELGKVMGLRAQKQYALFNGALPCKLLWFDIQPQWFVDETAGLKVKILPSEQWTEGAKMFANRLRKNLKQLGKWARQQQLTCYRLYDADMPEYALAIDCYNDLLHVQEYAPPASIDPQKAKLRLREALSVLPEVLAIPAERIVVKQRQQQKGAAQYEKLAEEKHYFEVSEGKARLLVNLTDYLDTGLFLDHRPVRLYLEQLAKGKRFLNLFCYTATATVHAALGGAIGSVSVDMSNTYL
ncbi:MAG: rlmL, partial [Gammaproteobacteria bacterium]|nr:rlmL [Gammaproteobacteria bacterium]